MNKMIKSNFTGSLVLLGIFASSFLGQESLAKPKNWVKDVTGLNPINVLKIHEPTTVEEMKAILTKDQSPISIGGGRYSMGGQTASEKTTHIDMRGFSKILRFDKKKKTITVQSGTRWRDIQDLSILMIFR